MFIVFGMQDAQSFETLGSLQIDKPQGAQSSLRLMGKDHAQWVSAKEKRFPLYAPT